MTEFATFTADGIAQLADALIDLGRLALAFGRIDGQGGG